MPTQDRRRLHVTQKEKSTKKQLWEQRHRNTTIKLYQINYMYMLFRFEVVGSNPTNTCCVPTPTQRAIPSGSVNEYHRKLGSKWAYHAMHWPRIRGVRLRLVSGWGLLNGDHGRLMGPWGSGKDYTFYYQITIQCSPCVCRPTPSVCSSALVMVNDPLI